MSIETKLDKFVQERRHTPFSWGGQDCCLFACDWLVLATGVDWAKDWRGRYSTWLGAVRCIKRAGFQSLNHLAHVLGPRSTLRGAPSSYATAGDLMVFMYDDEFFRATLGVCLGTKSVVVGPAGLQPVSNAEAIACFKLPTSTNLPQCLL